MLPSMSASSVRTYWTGRVKQAENNMGHELYFSAAQIAAMKSAYDALVSPDAKLIKVADIISNTSDIAEADPDFARVYLNEKRLLLPVLETKHNLLLWVRATEQVDRAIKKLTP